MYQSSNKVSSANSLSVVVLFFILMQMGLLSQTTIVEERLQKGVDVEIFFILMKSNKLHISQLGKRQLLNSSGIKDLTTAHQT